MEQKDCKKYIECDAAKEAVYKIIVPAWVHAAFKSCIDDVPAADVRPVVRGNWVAVDFHTVKCPICGFEMDIMKVNDHILNHANFCTNCGTDMRRR